MSIQRRTEDAVLVGRALARQRGGATRLVAKYNRLLMSRVRDILPGESLEDDLAQETFLQAFRDLYQLCDPAKFKPWLMKIVLRVALTYRRATSFQRVEPAGCGAGDELDQLPAPGAPVEQRAVNVELWSAVTAIPEPYRTTLVQRFRGGRLVGEIAIEQGIDLPLAKYRLRRAIQLLRERLGGAPSTREPAAVNG